jgi:hypothetical protein
MAGSNEEAWWAVVGPDGVQRVYIRCGVDFFDPNRIVVRANVPVELVVSTTADLAGHSFVIALPRPGAGIVNAPVGPAHVALPFLPSLQGSFEAACRGNSKGPADRGESSRRGLLTVVP